MSEQLRDTVRHTEAMLNRCARDIADHVTAGDTTSESFTVITRLYRKLSDELADANRQLDAMSGSSPVM